MMKPRTILLAAAVFLTVIFALLLQFARPAAADMAVAACGVFLLWALATAAAGVTAAATMPPLPPVADISVLGRRAVQLSNFVLAVAALFGTTALSGMTGRQFQTIKTTDDMNAVEGELGQLLLTLLVVGLVVYWLWIPIDLMRAGKVRRQMAVIRGVRRYNRHAEQSDGTLLPRSIARGAAWLVSSSAAVPVAFYLVAALVAAAVSMWPQILQSLLTASAHS
jgi:hypothetical protein